MKKLLQRILGPANLGRLDFLRHAGFRASWGGPFNGQRYRLRIFFDLLYAFPIQAIVETGTFRGTTTALFASTCLPVYTAEANPRYYAYSSLRFSFTRQDVHLRLSDSRSFLTSLGSVGATPLEDAFFYLDAHWHQDLPLREELEIIFTKWERAIVMVDDFHVPNSAYGFDDYGSTGALDLGLIAPLVAKHELGVFFPAVPDTAETGMKRGSVVLCRELAARRIAASIGTLVRHEPAA